MAESMAENSGGYITKHGTKKFCEELKKVSKCADADTIQDGLVELCSRVVHGDEMEKLMCEVVEHTCMNLENRLRRAGMRPGLVALVGLVRSKMVDAHLVDLQKAMEGLKQMDGR